MNKSETRFRNWMLAAMVTGCAAWLLLILCQSFIGFLAFAGMFIISVRKMFNSMY